jgi:hypothetical protein
MSTWSKFQCTTYKTRKNTKIQLFVCNDATINITGLLTSVAIDCHNQNQPMVVQQSSRHRRFMQLQLVNIMNSVTVQHKQQAYRNYTLGTKTKKEITRKFSWLCRLLWASLYAATDPARSPIVSRIVIGQGVFRLVPTQSVGVASLTVCD